MKVLDQWANKRQKPLPALPFIILGVISIAAIIFLGFSSGVMWWDRLTEGGNPLVPYILVAMGIVIISVPINVTYSLFVNLNRTYFDPAHKFVLLQEKYGHHKKIMILIAKAQAYANYANQDLMIDLIEEAMDTHDKLEVLLRTNVDTLDEHEYELISKSITVLREKEAQYDAKMDFLTTIVSDEEALRLEQEKQDLEFEKQRLKEKRLQLAAEVVSENTLLQDLGLGEDSQRQIQP